MCREWLLYFWLLPSSAAVFFFFFFRSCSCRSRSLYLQESPSRTCPQVVHPDTRIHIVNEGLDHLPRFRATVSVDGKSYTSLNTFLHRKEAEQDVARTAYDALSEIINSKPELVFSKSIVNEFAKKMRLDMPVYRTHQLEGDTPSFTSSLLLKDVAYPACVGKNKKEAEQLAARAAILKLLGNAESEAALAPILKAKARLYANMPPNDSNPRVNSALPLVETAVVDGGASTEKAKETLPDDTMLTFVPPRHEFRALPALPGPSTAEVNLPIMFVPASSEQQPDGTPGSSKKRRKNKKKGNKKARIDEMSGSGVHPLNQGATCSVSLTR